MSKAGQSLRIEDLGDPILTPMQKMAREAMSQVEVDLSEEGILAEAREQTGLDDFGSDDFRERLRVWLQSVAEDDGLCGLGLVGVVPRMVAEPNQVPEGMTRFLLNCTQSNYFPMSSS